MLDGTKPQFDETHRVKPDYFTPVVERTHALVEKQIRRALRAEETGVYFFRSDTGTGKTSGVIFALQKFPEARIAIAVPTTADAQIIYEQLKDALSAEIVGVWSQDHENGKYGDPVDRREESAKRVFVGTHNFLLGARDPRGHVGARDLLIVDEIPQTMSFTSLGLTGFSRARERALELNLPCASNFTKVMRWAEERQTLTEGAPNTDFRSLMPPNEDKVQQVLEEVSSLRASDREPLQPVLDFVVSVCDQRAFERVQRTGAGHKLIFASFGEPASWFPKQLILSATPHLDGYQHSPDAKNITEDEGSLVQYDNLTIHSAPWPDLPKEPKRIAASSTALFLAVDHMRELIRRTVTDRVLIVVPEPLRSEIETNLREKPVGSKEVKVTNWGRDVGSNAYRECGDVILWANFHKPKHVTVAEWFVYSQNRVTPELLSEHAGKGKLKAETTENLQQGQLYAQIKQMGCRGAARKVDENGVCNPMHLWICWADLDPLKLDDLFPGHSFEPETNFPDRFASSTSDTIARLLIALGDSWENELTYNDLAGPMGVTKKTLQNRQPDLLREQPRLHKHGWKLVPGGRGPGKRSKFVRLKPI